MGGGGLERSRDMPTSPIVVGAEAASRARILAGLREACARQIEVDRCAAAAH